MTEQEAAQDFARRLFGSQPDPEPDEPEPSEAGTEVKADDEPANLSTPEERHNQFLTAMFRGSPARREADERFFRTVEGHDHSISGSRTSPAAQKSPRAIAS